MKRLILFFALMTATVHAAVALSYDFSADNDEGVTIYYKINDDGNTVSVTKNYDDYYKGTVNIPQSVTNEGTSYSVTAIGESAFSACWDLTSVTIPVGVTTIDDRAFYSSGYLTNISIPDGVKTIGNSAFDCCYSLSDITLPNSLEEIGEYAFMSVPIRGITIPEKVKSIGSYAFRGCAFYEDKFINNSSIDAVENDYWGANFIVGNLRLNPKKNTVVGCSLNATEVVIPESVTEIGANAFSQCIELTSVTIPSSVTTIRNGAFSYCKKLASITIPASVTSIEERAFYGCAFDESNFFNFSTLKAEDNDYWNAGIKVGNLIISRNGKYVYAVIDKLTTEETIPEGVIALGSEFSDCKELIRITIPESVNSFEVFAFSGCSKLTSINIPEGVTSISACTFKGCSSLSEITIPESVTLIDFCAFEGCSSLTKITLPKNVTKIDFNAFNSCSSLRSITIPESVEYIGDYAFYGCTFEKSKFINNSALNAEDNNYWGATIVEDGSITTIRHPSVNAELIATEYFSLNGQKLAAPQHGINIIRKTYSDGKTETQKVIIK